MGVIKWKDHEEIIDASSLAIRAVKIMELGLREVVANVLGDSGGFCAASAMGFCITKLLSPADLGKATMLLGGLRYCLGNSTEADETRLQFRMERAESIAGKQVEE